jgi:glycosyltransferase 2 family protein
LRINNWRFWLGLGVSVFFLLILVYSVDLQKITATLSKANYLYVAPAIGLYFVAVYFRSIRWRYLLSPLCSLKVERLYPVVIIGYMANNLLPVRLGELVRSYCLAQREQVSGSSALATIAIERVYDGVVLLAFAALSAPLLLLLSKFNGAIEAYRPIAIALAGGAVAIFLLGLAFLTLASFPWFARFITVVLRFIPARFRPKAEELAFQFLQGLSILNSPQRHLKVFLLSIPVWLMEGGSYFLIGYSFGINTFFDSFWILLLVLMLLSATSNLATALPTSIGGIGPFEVAAQQTLVALGVGASVAAVYAGFLHVVALWLPVNLVGLALLWKHNLSLRRLATIPEAATSGYRSGLPRPNEEIP